MTTTLVTQPPRRPVPPPLLATQARGADRPSGPADREYAVILMPVIAHTDGPADDEVLHELAEPGLRHYTTQTATAVGTGPEAAWSEWADMPSAYIALEHRLPAHPDRDMALIWAAERGWSVAVETGCGEDLLITASLGDDVLPPPEAVAAFVRAVLTGQHTGTPRRPSTTGRADLTQRLADWAEREPAPDARTS